ncbi:MAG: MaoC family dehydratase N-terminal domain-containing protein [Actinobacteria bacterium]|nr:MaoC family dehydratase N-terminal domain-containing protein [Actinomycetota bacterium]
MALNPDRVGHRYPAYRFEVGREHVRTYADVTGVVDERYHNAAPESVADGLAVPPAFVACIAGAQAWGRVMQDPQLGAHDRVMHGGQELEFTAPVRIGDVLICTPMITDLRAIRGLELLTVEVDCTRQDGEAVVTSRSRLAFMPERGPVAADDDGGDAAS